MRCVAPYLLNLCMHAMLAFLLFALFMEGLIALFRVRNVRMKYWMRAVPFLKLPLLFLSYSGQSWIYLSGQTIACQPVNSRMLTVAFEFDKAPYFSISAHTEDKDYFGLGDVLREWAGEQAATILLVVVAVISCALLAMQVVRTLQGHCRLREWLRSAPLISYEKVAIYESRVGGHSPLTWGLFRPKILFPLGLKERLSSEEYAAILAHEREHSKWKDPLILTVIEVVCTLFWFIPALKWFRRNLVLTQEMACDRSANPQALAGALSKVVRLHKEGMPQGALPFVSRRAPVLKRLRALAGAQQAAPSTFWKRCFYCAALFAVFVFVMASTIFPF